MTHRSVFSCALLAGLSLMACSSSRDVEVSGEVASSATAQGDIVVEFFDVDADDELSSVHSITLSSPGAFSETIPFEGDALVVRAVADTDGDGACSAGEAWGEVRSDISDDDTAEGLRITLQNSPCP